MFSALWVILQETNWGFPTFIVASTLLIITLVFVGLKLRSVYRHKRAFSHFLWLIPKDKYPVRQFANAPSAEHQSNEITISIGRYTLPFVLVAIENLAIRRKYPPVFEGESRNRPTFVTTDNPYVTQVGVSHKVEDWFGGIHTFEWVHNIDKDDFRIFGYQVQTYGEWNGKAMFEFYIEGVGRVRKKLRLRVSDSEDEIPFLKADNNETKTT